MPKEEKVIIFDTTLRDGEQTPGANLNTREKLEIARALALLGVDVIEAGFPFTSPGDFEAVRTVGQEVKGVTICALARSLSQDIDCAAEALEGIEDARIHVFIGTSPIHRKHQLRKSKSQVLKMARDGVKRARGFTSNVQFSPMDATRTEGPFLIEVLEAAIEAGATTLNIPDTVGYAMPESFRELITRLREEVEGIEKTVISVHCHNDLGLAVANSLAAIKAGAGQVECTINGLGERAGNASLEEIVMALATRKDFFNKITRIRTQRLYPTSRLVSALTGILVQRNKAVVGENAFAHESGIHQDGVLKEPTTFEIMKPEDVGLVKSKLVLGKLSGRHAFIARVKELGYELDEEALEHAFNQFKALADKKKDIYDEDIAAIVEEELVEVPEVFAIESFHTTSGTGTIPTATVRMRIADGSVVQDAACGDGPVDAIYKTIDRITGFKGDLADYHIRAITGGKDAMGEVTLEVRHQGKIVHGRATSTDIIDASAKAYLAAINRIEAAKERAKSR
ncbi:MAG: 2-isopropylmalate synthase [Planctomycetes bacterium DG_23]|nr:MAG: 2-isopropylmalate synthase [Planctomycetes bacterium DG_23]